MAKLHKVFRAAGQHYTLVDHEIRLQLQTPGRAVFTVAADKPISGVVTLDLGFSLNSLQRYFTGYVVTDTDKGAGRRVLFCRELSAALNRRLALDLRCVTLPQVMEEVANKTRLQFVTPEAKYTQAIAPRYYTLAGGYHAFDALGKVFNYSKPLWLQQGDGKVFVGSWEDSYWKNKPITLDPLWQSSFGVSDQATIPCIPRLRPGVAFNQKYLTQVIVKGNFMNLTWNQDPWKNPSRAS